MKPAVQIAATFFLVICFNFCRMQDVHHVLFYQADSILRMTLELQSRISSAEIQRMYDFQEEINNDIAILSPIILKDTTILKYMELHDGLGQCMQACNQYHEEAFMIESSLREIMDLVRSGDGDLKKIRDLLDFEISNYNDLSERIDSSMNLALIQAGIFYSLKPEINLIRQGLLPSPDR